MSAHSLYDDDVLLWSEQQAEVIRRMGRSGRTIPNELDVENVAEEIESVGRSELAAVESQLQNILSHLIKLALEPQSDAARHWQGELYAFHQEMRRRYAPSMRQRINLQKEWEIARRIAVLQAPIDSGFEDRLPETAPFDVAELICEELRAEALAQRLRTGVP